MTDRGEAQRRYEGRLRAEARARRAAPGGHPPVPPDPSDEREEAVVAGLRAFGTRFLGRVGYDPLPEVERSGAGAPVARTRYGVAGIRVVTVEQPDKLAVFEEEAGDDYYVLAGIGQGSRARDVYWVGWCSGHDLRSGAVMPLRQRDGGVRRVCVRSRSDLRPIGELAGRIRATGVDAGALRGTAGPAAERDDAGSSGEGVQGRLL